MCFFVPFFSGVCVRFLGMVVSGVWFFLFSADFCSWCVCLLASVIVLVRLFSHDLFSGVFRFAICLRGRGGGVFFVYP